MPAVSTPATPALWGRPGRPRLAEEIVSRGLNVRQVSERAKSGAKTQMPTGKVTCSRGEKRQSGCAGKARLRCARLGGEHQHRGRGGVRRIRYRNLDQLDDEPRRLEKKR